MAARTQGGWNGGKQAKLNYGPPISEIYHIIFKCQGGEMNCGILERICTLLVVGQKGLDPKRDGLIVPPESILDWLQRAVRFLFYKILLEILPAVYLLIG